MHATDSHPMPPPDTHNVNHRAKVRHSQSPSALTRVFANVARDLQRCAPLESDPSINAALGQVGQAMAAGRAYVFEVVDTVYIRNTHEWCAPGVSPMQQDLQHVPYAVGDLFWERFRDYGSLQIGDITDLMNMSEMRQFLQEQDITALICAPFWRNGEMIGFIGLDYTQGPRAFRAEEDNLMRGLAAQIGLLRALTVATRDGLRLENDLARTRARLSATVAALPELLVEADLDGVITGFHQSSPLTFAVRPQEVIGQMPEAVLPPHMAAICRKAMREVDLFGWSQSHTYSVQTPSGRKWYTLYASPRGPTGRSGHQTAGYLFVVRDATMRICRTSACASLCGWRNCRTT